MDPPDVAYIDIGSLHTQLIITDATTSHVHVQLTPPAVARAKRQCYRDQRVSLLVTLDSYLRSLWDSYMLQRVQHLVLVMNPTDNPEYVMHAVRWLTKGQTLMRSTVHSVTFPLYAAAQHGVDSDAVVVDFGHALTRMVPILHHHEMRELLRTSAGMGEGVFMWADESATPPSTWSPPLQSLLDSYLRLLILVDEASGGEGEEKMSQEALASLQGQSAAIQVDYPPRALAFIEHFAEGVDRAVSYLVSAARAEGVGEVLGTWVVAGGGASLPCIRNYFGYIAEKYAGAEDPVVIWTP